MSAQDNLNEGQDGVHAAAMAHSEAQTTVPVLETARIVSSDPEAESNLAEDQATDIKAEIKDFAKTVGIALAVVLVLRTFIFQPFTIPSASMEPNLYEGDYIITTKWDYGFSKHSILFSPPLPHGRIFESQPKRGDIVVFKKPSNTKEDFIKRVIGLPGDHIQVRDNQLYINGTAVPNTPVRIMDGDIPGGQDRVTELSETLPGGKVHLMQDWQPDTEADNTKEFVVPPGYFFMMGDNRDNSTDSRFAPGPPWDGVGYVPAENLEGKAQFILISWKPGSSLWKPWTWLNLRWDRFFKGLK